MKIKRVVAALLLSTTPACMSTSRVAPAEYVPQSRPSQILVLDNTGTVHLLDGPTIVGDSLIGIENGTPDTLALPVSQVEDAMVKHKSPGKTMALVGGLAAGAGLAITAIVLQGHGSPCKTGNNKPDQAGNVIGGNTQCDTTIPDSMP
ncbi:MAG: hypothetical protein HY700_14545 [Gemmatimonadetes bacterium]|nr:hypothetical protein [Gemmatimonadota bacterium]